MQSNLLKESTSVRMVLSATLLLLLLGGLVVLALEPRNSLEAGSGMGNERFPLGNGQQNNGSPASGGPSPSIGVTVNPSVLPGLSISTPISEDAAANDTTGGLL